MPNIDVLTHGAVGNGRTLDTRAIQAAIDAVHAGGGGRVTLPAGHRFLSGRIELRSRVELHVERGAVLQAVARWEDLVSPITVTALSSGTVNEHSERAGMLLSAVDAEDIAVTGDGVIDGAGEAFILERLGPIHRMPNRRPFTLFFLGCRNVTLRDITFRDAALWTVRLTGCEDIRISGIRIDNDMQLPNNDGIDLDRCRRAVISDCLIRCGDDAISLKTCEEFPEHGPCEDIVITNCVLQSNSSAIVVGVDATSPIRNVTVTNCVIRDSHRGLSVNLGQEGDFTDILFSDVVVETRIDDDRWWGRGEPIYVTAFPWHDRVGHIRNVRFRNILARSECGAFIAGFSPDLVSGIVLEAVRIELATWSGYAGGTYDRRPFTSGDPIYTSPIAGIHVDTATDVTLRDCEIVVAEGAGPWFGHAVEAIDAPGLVVEGLRGTAARAGMDPVLQRRR